VKRNQKGGLEKSLWSPKPASGKAKMTTCLSTTTLQQCEEVEYFLPFLITRTKLGPRDNICSEFSHVVTNLHLGLATLQRNFQRLEHLLSAFHHVPSIALEIFFRHQPFVTISTPRRNKETIHDTTEFEKDEKGRLENSKFFLQRIDTLSLSPMNAGATMWRWWYQSSPFAINSPCPMKFFEPCLCCQDFPDTVLYFERNSLINSVSVRHSLGSVPFQYRNLFPTHANHRFYYLN